MFCHPKCGVNNKMLCALSRKDTCRHLRWSFFAKMAHNFQPSILDVSMIPACISSYLVTVLNDMKGHCITSVAFLLLLNKFAYT